MIRERIRRAFSLALRRRDRWEREVEDEIKLHLTLRAEQLMAEGKNPRDAYDEAVRRFGPLDESRARLFAAAQHREHIMQRVELWDDLRQDVGFALRSFGRQKGWTAVAVITLALGIASATAVFSVVSSLLLHAITYPNAGRVVIVDTPTRRQRGEVSVRMSSPPPLVRFWQKHQRSLESIETYSTGPTMMLTTNGDQSQLYAARTLASFPSFAGAHPLRGRMFTVDEQKANAHVALLAENVWRARFGGDDRVLGRAITLDDSLYTVIGVMPSSLHFPKSPAGDPDIWLPLDSEDNRRGVSLLGRLRAGASAPAGERELDSLAAKSGVYGKELPFSTRLVKPSEKVSFHDSLLMLSAAVALVLLVACTNVAHLLIARGAARHRELAVRAALGAGRGRLVRQLVTESLVLSVVGSVAGVLIGQAGLKLLVAMRPSRLWELESAHLDATTIVVAVALTTLCGVVFGVLGALQSRRQEAGDALRTGAFAASPSRRAERARSLMVVTEMALSAMLLVGATLLVRSVINLQRTDVGFEPDGLYTLNFTVSEARYPTEPARATLIEDAKTRLRAVHGIRDVVATTLGPYSSQSRVGDLEIEGVPGKATSDGMTEVASVETSYFRTMGVPILEGRTFTDTSEASREVMLNAGFARRHWKPGEAVGRRIRFVSEGRRPDEWLTVVGIVRDVMLTGPGGETSAPLVYGPWGGSRSLSLMIRTDGHLDPVVPARTIMKSIDPRMPPVFVGSMRQLVNSAVERPRFTALLLGSFTMIAVVLAAVGLYGMMAYTVVQRTREIGIRVALGATDGVIARAVVGRGAILAVIGAAIGLVGAHWTMRFVTTLLYGVTPLDATSFAIGAVVLVGTALLACIVPTRRALAVDPMTAIRAD